MKKDECKMATSVKTVAMDSGVKLERQDSVSSLKKIRPSKMTLFTVAKKVLENKKHGDRLDIIFIYIYHIIIKNSLKYCGKRRNCLL